MLFIYYYYLFYSCIILFIYLLLLLSSFFPVSSNECFFFFYGSLSNSKFPQVFRTLLSILADFISAVVWIFLILFLLLISSHTLFSSSLGTVSTPTGITVLFIILNFLSTLGKSRYLSSFLLSLIVTL